MNSDEQSVREIREAIDKWSAALKEKDLDTMHRDYSEKFRLYDVGSTANDVEETKKLWEQCFPYFENQRLNIRIWLLKQRVIWPLRISTAA